MPRPVILGWPLGGGLRWCLSVGVGLRGVLVRDGVSAGGWIRVERLPAVGPYVQVWLVQLNVPVAVILCTSLTEKVRNCPLSQRLVHRNATGGAERCTYETCTPVRGKGELGKVTSGKRKKKQRKDGIYY